MTRHRHFLFMNLGKKLAQGIDLMPALFVVLFAFVAVGLFQFWGSWPTAERGLVIFEKACPIHAAPQNRI
jgi:hypothetical protein